MSASDAPRGPGRPRDRHRRLAILAATIDLLVEGGYADLTMEGVAARAGVAKTTLYRRWPSKGALVLEALDNVWGSEPTLDSKDPIGDLVRLMEQVHTEIGHPVTRTLLGLAADIRSDAELSLAFRERFVLPRRRAVALCLQQAIADGLVRSDVDVELITDLLVGPGVYRALVTGEPLEEGLAAATVRLVLDSIRA